MLLENYPVFIVHYTPLKERKLLLTEQLRREGLQQKAYWIENFDRETIKEWPEFDIPDQELNKGIVAVNMAHVDALWKIAESEEGYGLVLEDDVVFKEGAVKLLKEYSAELPKDWDMFFIGNGGGFHIPLWRRRPGKHVYLKENTKTWWGGDGATRCADSYFVTRKGALALLDTAPLKRPFRKPIDWALNQAIRDKNLKVYWLEPTLTHQGSQQGAYQAQSHTTNT